MAFEGGVTVTGFDIRDGRVHGVRTDRGNVECERVLLCAGIWGPTVGAMAGVPIPLVAVQHQLVWTDPVAGLEGETREVAHPILRHQDMAMYFRHRQDHYAVGSYRHEPIVTAQQALRRPGDGPMPSLMPFTPTDFDVAEAEAARLLPALEGRMRPADPERSINGMFSFTPDAGSIVGESARFGAVDLRGRVGHARRRVRQARRRVDRQRRALDRSRRGRRQPLLPVHDDAALRARARQAAVPGGVRHPPSAPADGAPSEAPAHALLRASSRARRRVRHRCGVGAPRVVRGQRRARALRRSVGAPGRLGRAALVADRRRRTPRDAFERGAVRPDAVREVRRRGARRARVPRADLREPDRPPVGAIVYTAMLTASAASGAT